MKRLLILTLSAIFGVVGIGYCQHATTSGSGTSFSDAIDAGTYDDFSDFQRIVNTALADFSDGKVYYRFTLAKALDVIIHTYPESEGMPGFVENTSIRLLREANGQMQEVASQNGSAHLSHVQHKGRAYYRGQNLPAGTYYVEARSVGERGFLPLTIIGSMNDPANYDRPVTSDPIYLGHFDRSFRYSWTADTRDSFYKNYLFGLANEMYYGFVLEKPMWIYANNYGSELDKTFLYLLKWEQNGNNDRTQIDSYASVFFDFPPENKTFMIDYEDESMEEMSFYDQNRNNGFVMQYLEPGTYYIVSSGLGFRSNGGGGVIENGVVRLNFYGFAENESEDIGTMAWGQSETRIQSPYYPDMNLPKKYSSLNFSCDEVSSVNIDTSGSSGSDPINLIIRTHEDTGPIAPGTPGATPDFEGTGRMELDSLPAGRYWIYGSDMDIVSYRIDADKPRLKGDTFASPLNAGGHAADFLFEDVRDMRYYRNNYGAHPAEDLYYRFRIECPMHIRITNYGTPSPRTFLTLLDASGAKITDSEQSGSTGNPEYPNQTADLHLASLPAGTYYVVCENGEPGDILLHTQIQGEIVGAHTPVLRPDMNRNFILSSVPTRSVANEASLTAENSQTSIAYYDQLGRPEQNVLWAQSPEMHDMVTHQEYDAVGRSSRSWLPVATGTDGGYTPGEQLTPRVKHAYFGDAAPYTQNHYDDSPLDRVEAVSNPGQQWAGRSTRTDLLTNSTTDAKLCCRRFRVPAGDGSEPIPGSASVPVDGGIYPARTLAVTQTTDENGQIAYSFADLSGRVLLERKMADGEMLDTYYIYDGAGDLRFVLPPMLSAGPLTAETVDRYAFCYRYDLRHRCVHRKMPGTGWTDLVYDAADHPVLSQDAEQHTRGEWTCAFFDALGREVLRGVITGTVDADAWRQTVVTARFDASATATLGYVSTAPVPLGSVQILSATYYDSYDFLGLAGFTGLGYAAVAESGERWGTDADRIVHKGLQTGSSQRVLGREEFVRSAIYYDYYKRPVQRRVASSDGGMQVFSTAYNFSGMATLERESILPSTGSGSDELVRRLTYDHAGRLLREQTTLNGGIPACVEYAYDELGRQTSTLQGEGAQSLRTTRQYNIRGWLLEQQNDLFSMRLSYLKPKYSASDSGFTGNIMEWTWRQGTSAENTYSFTYDGLSRLTGSMQYVNGTPSDRFVEKDLSYDLNGNVLHLSRTSSGAPSDSFDYSYTGNRLTTLSGTASGGYTYDSNGNMTRDGVNDLNVTYNRLNLIEKVTRNGSTLSNYAYLSDGAKLSATDGAGDGLSYLGSLVYRKQGGQYTLESAGFGSGRIVAQTTSSGRTYTPNYYVTDHLGSVRVVFDSRGEVKERNDYYPYGLRWDDADAQLSDNRYRYNGKEQQGFLNLPYTDYGARMYDPKLIIWHSPDPLIENYISIGPYVFCKNNPIYYIDKDGRKLNPSSSFLQPHLKRVMSSTNTGKQQLDKILNNKSDITIKYQKGYSSRGRTIYGSANVKAYFRNAKTSEIIGGRIVVTLFQDAINDRAKELGIRAEESEAVTLAEEAEHTEADNLKLQEEEEKEEEKVKEEETNNETEEQELESERQAHIPRDKVLREILEKYNR